MNVLPESKGIIPGDIAEIHFDTEGLRVSVESEDQTHCAHFTYVRGFRMLDEGDLLEFWSADDYKPEGWVFEVENGGWFEQEKNRSGFLSSDALKLREFLVATSNSCLSILARETPKLSKTTSE
jgi:hypothetical protein